MKNRIILVLSLLVGIFSYAQKPVQDIKKEFTSSALEASVIGLDGKKTTVGKVLEPYRGKVVVLDFWASWCQDCILALPKTKELKDKFEHLEFIYLSVDRSHAQWTRGLEKYGLNAEKNYWFDQGWKNTFNDYIELNWVPRFLVVDQSGKIAHYYSISPEDPLFLKTLESIL